MAQKAFFGLFSAVARAGEAALVSVMMLLAGAGCVEPDPEKKAGYAGSPGLCSQIALDSCEAGGASGHVPADAGIGGEAGSGGDGGSDPAGAGGSPAGSGGASGDGGKAGAGGGDPCANGQGSTTADGKECPGHGGSGSGAGSSGAGGASGAGQGGAGAAGAGGSDPAGASGSSGSGASGAGGQAGNGPAGAGGASGSGGDAGAGGSGQSGAGQGGSSAGASGASASGAGGAGGAGAGGGTSGSGGSKAGAGGASGAGQGGAGAAGAGGSDPAGAGGGAGQAQNKPWGCKDFVVDSGFEDQQPDLPSYYQRVDVAGAHVFGSNGFGVDVLVKTNGAWDKHHVPESGDNLQQAVGPDVNGDHWFISMGGFPTVPRLFKGKGKVWVELKDAPEASSYLRLALSPAGDVYVSGATNDGARLWKRSVSGAWSELVGDHALKYMLAAPLVAEGKLFAIGNEEVWDNGSKPAGSRIFIHGAGGWSEFASFPKSVLRLEGFALSGEHGIVASGMASAATPFGFKGVALFIDVPSKKVTMVESPAQGSYTRSVYSPRFGSFVASASAAEASTQKGTIEVYDGLGFKSHAPFDLTGSPSVLIDPSSGAASFVQESIGSTKAKFATATCGEL